MPTQPHESATRPLQRAAGHIKGTPPLLIPVATMGKCKQGRSSIALLWSPDSLIIHEQNQLDSQFKVVLPYLCFVRYDCSFEAYCLVPH